MIILKYQKEAIPILNRVILIGRLVRDPELKYGKGEGTAICTFTLACDRKFKKGETDYIDCICFKGLAENCSQYLHKGSLCAVEGRIQVRTYEDKESKKRKATEVVADDVRFLDPKGKGDSKTSSPPPQDSWSNLGNEIDLPDDDPPF